PAAAVPDFVVIQTTSANAVGMSGALVPGATVAVVVAINGGGIRACSNLVTVCTTNGLPNGLAFTSFVAGTAFSVSDTANGGNPTYDIALEYNAALTPLAQSSAILTFPNSQIIASLSADSFVLAQRGDASERQKIAV